MPSNENGVFVTPAGAPDADGTREKPFGSIASAIEKARANSKRVYVCSGTYKESVAVALGIPLVGGLDCSTPTWKLGGPHARIESPTSPALRAENIDSETIVQGFDFVAPDGTAENPTSIGFLAKAAGKLKIIDSTITAGKGHDGAAGTEGVQLTSRATVGGQGEFDWMTNDRNIIGPIPEPPNVGAAGGAGACTGAPGIAGGNGGAGGRAGEYLARRCANEVQCALQPYFWEDATPGDRKSPGLPGSGNPATAGSDGASGTSEASLSADGYLPADGKAGSNGTPGQGGKGGTPLSMGRQPKEYLQSGQGETGGGGGAGGCPGMAGTPGRGGGASIGALITNSPGLAFERTDVVAGNAGAGGKGTFGSDPTVGSAGGTPHRAGTEPAAAGEPGGRAGVSGSGGGGWSIGIAYNSGEPVRTKTTVRVGSGGAGVPEASKPDALKNPRTLGASAAGQAKELVAF